ncbi:Nudix hydrolase 14 [Citrus sinensis]|uniref:Nudix hydrolase 14 n=1 Tax=Citrus sinensis TaxID=2711 RepID=A0ACB8LVK3_CITSI|nr:Nudix hydrolase 14 [Citrus sinensis]
MSQLFYTLPKRLTVSPSPPLLHFNYRSSRTRLVCSKMPTESSPSPLTHSITIPSQLSQPVHVVAAPGLSESDFRCAVESTLFKQWLKNLQSETGILANGDMLLKQVLIQGVDMFGKRIGFLKFKADIFCKETGQKVPGIVFARGPAVAVLILLDSEGETYAILTEQVEEETGIQLKLEDMIDLTAFLYPSTGCKFFPSAGGCDEEISLFLYRGRVDKEIIMQLQGKETGLRDHGELIKVRVVPYRELWRTTPDAKVLTAIALYEMASKEELLPSRT